MIVRDVLAMRFVDSDRSIPARGPATRICGNPLKIRVFKRAQ